MLIKPFQTALPVIDPDAYGAENATVIGMVTLAAGSSVWYNAVLRGDVEPHCRRRPGAGGPGDSAQ